MYENIAKQLADPLNLSKHSQFTIFLISNFARLFGDLPNALQGARRCTLPSENFQFWREWLYRNGCVKRVNCVFVMRDDVYQRNF